MKFRLPQDPARRVTVVQVAGFIVIPVVCMLVLMVVLLASR